MPDKELERAGYIPGDKILNLSEAFRYKLQAFREDDDPDLAASSEQEIWDCLIEELQESMPYYTLEEVKQNV
jgi:3-deoxy-D-manno-octulosonic-acid transferase